MTYRVFSRLGLCSVLALSACTSTRVLAPETLYERLGSLPGIEMVVEDFVANVAADPRINAFFANSNPHKLKRWLSEFLCANSGGPCRYTGRPMKAGHQDMAIREADFTALVEDLVRALEKHRVPAREREELLTLLGGLRGEIVTRP